ncbi:MAG TPA: hypothetical protein VFF24_09050, partial [Acidimicrobiia bacterium]|nr:hypothetical protein [Acidimicrobiia bacterium]
VPFSLRGTGTGAGNCVSEGSAGGTFDIEMRIGDLRCDGIAGYTRFGPWLQMVAGLSACDNGERPVGGWVFELAYTNGRLAGPVSLLPA